MVWRNKAREILKIGDRVKIGYYDQNHQGLNPKKNCTGRVNVSFCTE